MNKAIETEFLKKLEFRRQFLLGPDKYLHNKYWHSQKLKHKLFLSIHKDLSFFSKEKNGLKITIMGVVVDCIKPTKTVQEIVTTLLDCFDDIYSVIEASKPLAGRWVLICQDANNTFIFTDPCGLRQVYFSTGKNGWCASQPTLINQIESLSFTSNEAMLSFRNSPAYKKRESAWIGNKTVYDDCMHLMPNHYLDLNKRCTVRFFPKQAVTVADNTEEIVTETATYLKNIINGLAQRYNVEMGLSAGFDSRLLLAASVDMVDKISYNTGNSGRLKRDRDDIYVPQNLARRLHLNHHIILETDKNLPAWFCEILSKNILEARISPPLSKVTSIYNEIVDQSFDHISLSGNTVESVRIDAQRLKPGLIYNGKDRSGNLEVLLKFTGYNNKYVENEISLWMDSLDISLLKEAKYIDMFYWEQRMGNWGALYSAEHDMAAEVICPFNCRLLLETCLKVPREQRKVPDCLFFRKVIKKNWPEVLLEPINPGPKGFGLVKEVLRENLPPAMVKYLRKFVP